LVTKFQNTGSIKDERSENTTRQRDVLTQVRSRDKAALQVRVHIVDLKSFSAVKAWLQHRSEGASKPHRFFSVQSSVNTEFD